MKMPPICIPVMGETISVFLSHLRDVMALSDFIELRFDSLRDVTSEKQVKILKTILSKITRDTRFIFTCRPRSEGGAYRLGEAERKVLIESFIEMYHAQGFTNGYIDIESSSLAKWSFELSDMPLIVSYHNYSKTPSTHEMIKLVVEMKKYHPRIVKIATMVNSEEDCHNLYRLQLSNLKVPMLVIGMGEKGKVTRVVSPLLGSPWVYASSQYGASAPGQYQFDEIRRIFSLIVTNC